VFVLVGGSASVGWSGLVHDSRPRQQPQPHPGPLCPPDRAEALYTESWGREHDIFFCEAFLKKLHCFFHLYVLLYIVSHCFYQTAQRLCTQKVRVQKMLYAYINVKFKLAALFLVPSSILSLIQLS